MDLFKILELFRDKGHETIEILDLTSKASSNLSKIAQEMGELVQTAKTIIIRLEGIIPPKEKKK